MIEVNPLELIPGNLYYIGMKPNSFQKSLKARNFSTGVKAEFVKYIENKDPISAIFTDIKRVNDKQVFFYDGGNNLSIPIWNRDSVISSGYIFYEVNKDGILDREYIKLQQAAFKKIMDHQKLPKKKSPSKKNEDIDPTFYGLANPNPKPNIESELVKQYADMFSKKIPSIYSDSKPAISNRSLSSSLPSHKGKGGKRPCTTCKKNKPNHSKSRRR
jgi:hypothetical protein